MVGRQKRQGKLFIVSAPSGAGKTTLVTRVLEQLEPYGTIKRFVTCTTRPLRADEVPGRDFHCLTVPEFEQRIQEGYFLEWSGELGNYYGTGRSVLDECAQGISNVLIVDRNGARQIRKEVPDVVLLWISVPSIDVLKKRLLGRGTDVLEHVERRLARAMREVEEEQRQRFYTYHVINDVLSRAVEEMVAIFKTELGVRISEQK